MARWLKAEFLHCSHIAGFFILVDLLSRFMVGVGGVVMGFVIGVGFGDGWAGFVAGVGVMGGVWFRLHLVWGESGGGYRVGGRGMFTSMSLLVGVIRGVVSFLGVWKGVGGRSVGDLGDVVVSSDGKVGGR